jgi:1,4-alpha-glucan branching enzyme
MEFRYASSIVLEAHLPYVRDYRGEDNLAQSGEEGWFFEAVSETYLPLLEVMDRLEIAHVPFRLAIAFSPPLCHMLGDEHLMKKYLAFTDKQAEFGRRELERTSINNGLYRNAEHYYNKTIERRTAFTEQYNGNILKAFDRFRRKGKIEILASSATHAFLPFMNRNSESIQAQLETAVPIYRKYFGGSPQGFFPPELGWDSAIEPYLRAYNFGYAIVDSHGFMFGNPAPLKGSFYPVRTHEGTYILSRDFYAVREIEKITEDAVYRDNSRDAGYELDLNIVNSFCSEEGERRKTGFKYWACRGQNAVYDIEAAADRAGSQARSFLENTINRLKEAAKHINESPISLYAHNADAFGRFWYEGPQFLETLFRMAADCPSFQFICPGEYIYKQNLLTLQTSSPQYSSWGYNGYAETWLDSSNDWIYRHMERAMERMTELAERFPNDSGLKERALNQAAREILLAQSSDWPELLYKQDSTEYARSQAENALRNFTTIYEALGSNYISTEWLTSLERRHNFFPQINYRVFRRKK